MPFVRYSTEVSALIEHAYQQYQRFVFLGALGASPGPYAIDFGSLCDDALSNGPFQYRADGDKSQMWRVRAVRRVAV